MPGASRSARQALDGIYAALLSSGAAERSDTALIYEILYQLDVMTQARRARLVARKAPFQTSYGWFYSPAPS